MDVDNVQTDTEQQETHGEHQADGLDSGFSLQQSVCFITPTITDHIAAFIKIFVFAKAIRNSAHHSCTFTRILS